MTDTHLETWQAETATPAGEREWLAWVDAVAHALGLDNLDGDRYEDGYSLDHAHSYFESGMSVERAVEYIRDNIKAANRPNLAEHLDTSSLHAFVNSALAAIGQAYAEDGGGNLTSSQVRKLRDVLGSMWSSDLFGMIGAQNEYAVKELEAWVNTSRGTLGVSTVCGRKDDEGTMASFVRTRRLVFITRRGGIRAMATNRKNGKSAGTKIVKGRSARWATWS